MRDKKFQKRKEHNQAPFSPKAGQGYPRSAKHEARGLKNGILNRDQKPNGKNRENSETRIHAPGNQSANAGENLSAGTGEGDQASEMFEGARRI